MAEGKRGRSQEDHEKREENTKKIKRWGNNRDSTVCDELVVYRILCPDSVMGSVIGKGGKVINSIRRDTKAKVKILDPLPGAKDRVIAVYCYLRNKGEVEIDEELDSEEPLCPAQDALLKVHAVIANAVASLGNSNKRNDREECQILVPSSQSATIIGKLGSNIKRLRSKTRAAIKVISKDAGDPTHACAMEFDNFVLITGDPEAVNKALFAVSTIMFKFTPKEAIPLKSVSDAPPIIIIPSNLPIYHASNLYPSLDHSAASRGLPPVLGITPISSLSGYADAGSGLPVYSSALPVVSGYGSASRSEELILRVLCPSDKIGRVIGKGGSTIKTMRQASGARIEVENVEAGDGDERLIVITSAESSDDLKSMSVEAVLLLQEKINDEGDETVIIRLLVSAKVIGCIIGRRGSIINEIRNKTKANVRISQGRNPKCAGHGDELVEVVGRVTSVREALIQVVLRLRYDALKEKETGLNSSSIPEPIYWGCASFHVPSVMPNILPVTRSSYQHKADIGASLGVFSSSSLHGHDSLLMRNNDYGSFSYDTSKPYGGFPPVSTLEMVIPCHAVGKVLGKGGANLANIGRISGAVVEMSEKSSCGDRVALISGTPEQKRSAENLIQAFIMAT